MKQNTKKTIIILACNILIILLAAFRFYWTVRHLPVVDSEKINTATWRGRNLEFRDGGIFVDRAVLETGEKSDFLWGPYAPLKKGSYTAYINYEAETDQSCFAGFDTEGGESFFYRASTGILSSFADHAVYQFEITNDVEEFQLVIQYNGIGDFGIRSISVVPNNNLAKREFVQTLIILVLADFALVIGCLPDQKKHTVFILIGISCLVSIPITVKGVFLGHDLEFHLLRIESIVDALRSGQFPARISTLALWGLGYPFSIYYNDIFLYISALLRLFGFSVTAAYKIYLVLINFLTVVLSYYSFRKITASRKNGLILTLLYAASAYRLINLYIRSAAGEYTAQAFLPLLALALYKIYGKDETESRRVFRNAVLLIAAFSGIIGSHILTLLITGFLMALIALVLWRRTLKKTVLLTFVTSFAFTVVLNLYFLVPFFDYFLNVPTNIGNLVGEQSPMIQAKGVYPGQLFTFFQGVMGEATQSANGRLQLTPGLPMMAFFLAAVCLRLFANGKKPSVFLLGFSSLTLLLSTDIFPWDWLSGHFVLFRFLAQIQFPWRFLSFSVLFLTLLAGDVLGLGSALPPYFCRAVVSAGVLMSFWFASNLLAYDKYTFIYDTQSINLGSTGQEYLLANTSVKKYNTDLQHSGMKDVAFLSKKSNRIFLNCITSDISEEHRVTVPLFNYKGYHVIGSDGQEFSIANGEQNHISFLLPDSYSGSVIVEFRDPVYWTVSLYASAVFFSLLIIVRVAKCSRRRSFTRKLHAER